MPYFWLLAFSGMRRGEALALEWKDIDFSNGTISIQRGLIRDENGVHVGSTKTIESKRNTNIDSQTCVILKKWQIDQKQYQKFFGNEYLGSDNFVFSNENNSDFVESKPNR